MFKKSQKTKFDADWFKHASYGLITHLKCNDTESSLMRRWRIIYQANPNQEKAKRAMVILKKRL